MRDVSELYYATKYASMQIVAEHLNDIRAAARLIVKYKFQLYTKAEARTGVSWVMFGLAHLRESSCRPESQILNGEQWRFRTQLVPKGLGPWLSWEDAALEGARRHGWVKEKGWPIPTILAYLERYNGMGYAKRDLDSPYVWSFTNHGLGVGKFVADGRYDPKAVDKQAGVAPVLKCLIDMNEYLPGA